MAKHIVIECSDSLLLHQRLKEEKILCRKNSIKVLSAWEYICTKALYLDKDPSPEFLRAFRHALYKLSKTPADYLNRECNNYMGLNNLNYTAILSDHPETTKLLSRNHNNLHFLSITIKTNEPPRKYDNVKHLQTTEANLVTDLLLHINNHTDELPTNYKEFQKNIYPGSVFQKCVNGAMNYHYFPANLGPGFETQMKNDGYTYIPPQDYTDEIQAYIDHVNQKFSKEKNQ